MAVPFNKEIISEAIQEVLVEMTKDYTLTTQSGKKIHMPFKNSGDAKKYATVNSNIKSAEETMEEETISVGHVDDEPGMLKQFAFDTAEYAAKLYKLLHHYEQMEDHVDFPNWWQHKVMMAREYMSKATHYLEFETMKPQIDAAVDGHSEEELDEDYVPRTKEDLVFQYLRDAWQFGAMKGKDVNPDGELSTMADSLLANLPDYDAAELSELFGRAKNKIVNYQGHNYEILDIDSAGTFTLIDPKHKFYVNKNQMKQGRVPDVKEPEVEDVPLMNLKEDDIAAPAAGFEDDSAKAPKGDKKLNKAASKNDKIISTYKKIKPLFKKAAAGDKEALAIVKANQDVIKAYKNLTQTHLAENKATCCGKCGRTHVKGTECKKPFLTGKDHCRVR